MKPTATQMVLRYESAHDKRERADIRREMLTMSKRDPEMRAAFNWLDRAK